MKLSGIAAYIAVTMGPTIGLVLGTWQAEFLSWFGRELIALPARIVNRFRNKYGKKH